MATEIVVVPDFKYGAIGDSLVDAKSVTQNNKIVSKWFIFINIFTAIFNQDEPTTSRKVTFAATDDNLQLNTSYRSL